MSGQNRHKREPLGAVGALERPLPCVNAQVFHVHEAEREPFFALITLIGSLPSVCGQMPLYIRSPRVCFLTMRTLKHTLYFMHLSVLRASKQGIEAFVALLADVAFVGDVRLPVLVKLGGSGEALTADGADLRKLDLLRVRLLMVDGQGTEVGEGAPAQLAGEGNGSAVIFILVFGQIPRVLEGSVTLGAVERSLSSVRQLVSPHV